LHPSGFEEVLIYNADRLKEIDPKSQAARIAHTVGKRKRAKILSEARDRNIVVLNQRQTKEATEKEEELAEDAEKEAETEETKKTEEPQNEEKADKRNKRAERQ
jgi:hypothetical protein